MAVQVVVTAESKPATAPEILAYANTVHVGGGNAHDHPQDCQAQCR